jgi:undecaprenyl-diphosphatase
MRWITHLGDAWATIGVGLGLWLAGGATAAAGRAALVANALSHVAVQILKRTVARQRPCDGNGVPLALVDVPDPFSFPSGHSAASTAVAATLAIAHPWLAPLVLPLAALVCASRVRLAAHHLTDVVAGVALGLAGALAAHSLLG